MGLRDLWVGQGDRGEVEFSRPAVIFPRKFEARAWRELPRTVRPRKFRDPKFPNAIWSQGRWRPTPQAAAADGSAESKTADKAPKSKKRADKAPNEATAKKRKGPTSALPIPTEPSGRWLPWGLDPPFGDDRGVFPWPFGWDGGATPARGRSVHMHDVALLPARLPIEIEPTSVGRCTACVHCQADLPK